MSEQQKQEEKEIHTSSEETNDSDAGLADAGKYYATIGRRKSATTQVRLYFESKERKIEVNGKDFKEYFPIYELQHIVESPLNVAGLKNEFFISAHVRGGGVRGQAESIRLGIARALIKYNPELRKALKAQGFLKRDPRVKERKKPGLKRARRAPQWQKR